MSANTAKSGLTYPSLADPPNIPSNLQTLAGQLDGMVIPKYASATAMNTANPTPTAGDMCYRTDLAAYLSYYSGAWVTLAPAGTWTNYTPVWSGGFGSIGASVSTGRWIQIGKTVHAIGRLVWGSGSTFSVGNVSFSLPVASASVARASGSGAYFDGGSTTRIMTADVPAGSSTGGLYGISTSNMGWQSPGGLGYTWASGAELRVQVTYESV